MTNFFLNFAEYIQHIFVCIMLMLLWMYEFGECWQSPSECLNTPIKLVNVENL